MEVSSATLAAVQEIAVAFGLKLLGAFALWWAGRQLIHFGIRMMRRALLARQIDPTLQTYLASILSVVLNVVLVIGILGFFGIETTSFAALMAAAGIAIGAAWSGLLSNFAAGAFLVMLRPFKVGDSIDVGSVAGTVSEIGLFSTQIRDADNVVTMVGNAKILGGDIRNYSASRFRRFSRAVVVPDGTPLHASVARLKAGLASTPNVLAEPAPTVVVADLVDGGVKIEARLCVGNDHYGQVADDVNRLVGEQFGPAA